MNKELYEEESEESEEWSPLKTAALMKRLVIQKCYNKDEEICAICLEQMNQRMCEYLPCTHVFHFKCLGQLIEKRIYTCPLCRYDFKGLLAAVGVDVQEEVANNYVLTIFTNMDLYDFTLELLWRSYGLTNVELEIED